MDEDDEWINGWTDGWLHGWVCEQTDEWTDKEVDGRNNSELSPWDQALQMITQRLDIPAAVLHMPKG